MNEVGLNRSLNKRVVRATTFIGILAVVGESTVDDRLVFSQLTTDSTQYCPPIVLSKDTYPKPKHHGEVEGNSGYSTTETSRSFICSLSF